MADTHIVIAGDIEPIPSSQGDRLRIRIKRTAADSQRLQGDRPPRVVFDARIPVEELRAYAKGLRGLGDAIEKYANAYEMSKR